jgi:hypothetical protein
MEEDGDEWEEEEVMLQVCRETTAQTVVPETS